MTGDRPGPVGRGSTAPVLEVNQVTCGYGRTVILRDVSVELRAAETKAILGANGAGKTTLLRAISGFIPITGGSIKLLGREVGSLASYRRAELGLCHIQEGRGIFRSLTVRENLLMQSRRGDEATAIERACEAFPRLQTRLAQRAGTLSGGEQKMLALAAAYIQKPKIIIVDEASLGLAPRIVSEVFTFLETLSRTGVALLIVDQFVHQALRLSKAAYVMRKGTIVYDGPSENLQQADLAAGYFGV